MAIGKFLIFRISNVRFLNSVCHDGFQCDGTRCIPGDWKCDGHIDCEDEQDESNCTNCPGTCHTLSNFAIIRLLNKFIYRSVTLR